MSKITTYKLNPKVGGLKEVIHQVGTRIYNLKGDTIKRENQDVVNPNKWYSEIPGAGQEELKQVHAGGKGPKLKDKSPLVIAVETTKPS